MKVKLTRGLDVSKRFGKISRIELPNKSMIYITKKGWTLVTPPKSKKRIEHIISKLKEEKKIETLLTYTEINLAIDETIAQGYIDSR